MALSHRFSRSVSGMVGLWRRTGDRSSFSRGHFPDFSAGRMVRALSENASSSTHRRRSCSVAPGFMAASMIRATAR